MEKKRILSPFLEPFGVSQIEKEKLEHPAEVECK